MGTYRCAEMGEEPEDEVCAAWCGSWTRCVMWVKVEVCGGVEGYDQNVPTKMAKSVGGCSIYRNRFLGARVILPTRHPPLQMYF